MSLHQYTHLPKPWLFYLKALIQPKSGFQSGSKPEPIAVTWRSFRFPKAKVKRYAKLCNLNLEQDWVPLLFPHSFFGPLHLRLITDSSFPERVLGSVHVRNHVMQHEPLSLQQNYSAKITTTQFRRRPQGLEVDIRTDIRLGKKLCWQSISTILFRKDFSELDEPSQLEQSLTKISDRRHLGGFQIPKAVGKQFGMLTKDLNPIHMSRHLARQFGFKRDICHGMWAVGRTLDMIQAIDYTQPVRNDVAFKGPMFIGSEIEVKISASQVGQFELYCNGDERPCVVASIRNVAPGARL